MTALDYLDSGICRFADMYFDWCMAEGREIKSDEGDELLQQVGMICQSDVTIEELLDVLKTNWSEDENNWKAIFGQKFSLVHSDSVITEFDTILQVLILAYRRKVHVEADTDNSSEGEATAVIATLYDWKEAFPRQCPKLGIEAP